MFHYWFIKSVKMPQMFNIPSGFSISLIIFFRLLIIVSVSVFYFYIFLLNKVEYFDSLVTFVNTPDHLRFVSYIENGFGGFHLSGVNNYSIVALYTLFSDFNLIYISFLINLLVFIVGYIFLEKICFIICGRSLRNISFCLLLVLVPFVLMINKDIFVFLFFMSCLLWWYTRRLGLLILLVFVSIIKVQLLPIFLLFVCFLLISRMGRYIFLLGIFFVYLIFSIMSSYFSRLVFDLSMYQGGGIVVYLKNDLNMITGFGGDFLLNVLLPIQYIYDILLSIVFSNDILQNVASSLKLFFVTLFLFNLKDGMKAFYMPWMFLSERFFPVVVLLISIVLVSMNSPVINYRYFLPIIPLFLLLFDCRFYLSGKKEGLLTTRK